jgi:hypothetical protein
VLEDQHEQAVGGADGEQVQDDRRQRDHDRAERREQEQEREPEHERDHPRHPRLHLLVEVPRSRGFPRNRVLDAVELAERARDDDGAQRVQCGERRGVVAAPGEPDLRARAPRVQGAPFAGRRITRPGEAVSRMRVCGGVPPVPMTGVMRVVVISN